MNEKQSIELLLPIKDNNGSKAVNAKDLYLFLGYDKSQWSRWYTTNIVNNDYAEEGVDYQTFDMTSNGNITKDFALSMDFAKELSMLARNERGKQARKYFIACEEKLRTAAPKYQIPQTYSEALMLAAKQAEQLELQQKQLEVEGQKRIQAETKVTILTHTNKTYTATEVAKEMGMRSAKELNKWLEQQHVQYKVNETWVPCAKYSDMAWFEIKQEELDNGHIIYHRKITGLGREGILDLYNNVK